MKLDKMYVALAGLVVLMFLVAGLANWLSRPEQSKPAAEPPSKLRIIDWNGVKYYTDDFKFDEQHKCVVFQDKSLVRQLICGNFRIEAR